VAQFQALPHLTGEDEENHVKGQLEWPIGLHAKTWKQIYLTQSQSTRRWRSKVTIQNVLIRIISLDMFFIYQVDNMYYARSWILPNAGNIVDWEEILITAWQCVMQPSCEASKADWPRQHGGIQHTVIRRWNTARQQHDNKPWRKATLTNESTLVVNNRSQC
jgi:hypothetical protein